MKKKLIWIIAAVVAVCAIAAVSLFLLLGGEKDPHADQLLLHLSFDEGSGTIVKDVSGNLPDMEMSYNFANAVFMADQEPLWREKGIKNGCLLFDGTSTYVTYNKNVISVTGDKLTINVWVAPRTFEWDDPNGAENGNDTLTGIVGQSDKANKKGFILGYQRHGRLSFQVGTGSEWLTVWTNGDNLQKYEWNLVTATFDAEAGEMRLYLNGMLVASRSVPAGSKIAPASRPLLVGRNGEGERLTAGFRNVISGYMDELKLYCCALTTEENADY